MPSISTHDHLRTRQDERREGQESFEGQAIALRSLIVRPGNTRARACVYVRSPPSPTLRFEAIEEAKRRALEGRRVEDGKRVLKIAN